MTSPIESFDIVSMVNDNPLNKLSGDYESIIISKIKEQFNTEEQKLFIANCYCYINYDNENDFIVEFDNVWKMLEFGRIEECKRVLVKHFKENVDYRAEKAIPPIGGKPNLGGRPKENIFLTINCFKKLCLKSGTKKADEIHDYYIKLEKIVSQTAKEESEKLRNQLLIKDKEIQKTKETNQNTLLLNFDKKNVVYVIQVEENINKFGISSDINRRMYEHKLEFGQDINLLFIFETNYNREFETMIKRDPILKTKIIEKQYKNNQTELIQLDKDFTNDHLNKKLNEIKKTVNGDLISNLLKENEELKTKVNEINKDLILENTKLKLENNIMSSKIVPEKNGKYIIVKRKGEFYEIDTSNERSEYYYKTLNSSSVLAMMHILLKKFMKNGACTLNIDKIKKVVEYCILAYDHYNILESETNLYSYVNRSIDDKNILQLQQTENMDDLEMKCEEYINVNVSNIPGQKVTIMQLQEDYVEWHEKTYGNINTGELFKVKFTKILTKILNAEPVIINTKDNKTGKELSKYLGFIDVQITKYKEYKMYQDEVYKNFYDSKIIPSENLKSKISRRELCDNFEKYLKDNNISPNPLMTSKSKFSVIFMNEITKYFENILEYDKNTTDTKYGTGGKGCFIGIKFKT